MPHTPLIETIVAALVLAFALGTLANRLRLSPLVGYLLAGVAVGPHTPGFVADQQLAAELADIGVILLMFGVGLQFSPKELLAVRRVAVPGAVVQVAVASLAGAGLAAALGWPVAGAVVFGLALSVASTVVVIRALDDRRLLHTEVGRISVGWLVVEDLITVLAIVLLPVLATAPGTGTGADAGATDGLGMLADIALTLGKAGAFALVMLVVGQRAMPWLLHYIAHTGSRELFRLGVLVLALGIAYFAATFVGVSFALGAFFAGLVLSESELSQQAAAETLPLRDAFAVLFFVSVGMLVDPAIVLREPWPLVGTVAVIMLVKPAAAWAVMRVTGHDPGPSLTVAASRAQIGEFSFILAGLGVAMGVIPPSGRDLILAGAILSILATPACFAALALVLPRLAAASARPALSSEDGPPVPTALTGHAIVVGHGHTGALLCDGLSAVGMPFLVVEERHGAADDLRARGVEVIHGHLPAQSLAAAANVSGARLLFIAIGDVFEAGQVAEMARAANPGLRIVAQAQSDEEAEHLGKHGADAVVRGEWDVAGAMLTAGLRVPPTA